MTGVARLNERMIRSGATGRGATAGKASLGLVYTVGRGGRAALKAHWGRYGEASLAEIYRRALPGIEDFVPFGIDPTPAFGTVGLVRREQHRLNIAGRGGRRHRRVTLG